MKKFINAFTSIFTNANKQKELSANELNIINWSLGTLERNFENAAKHGLNQECEMSLINNYGEVLLTVKIDDEEKEEWLEGAVYGLCEAIYYYNDEDGSTVRLTLKNNSEKSYSDKYGKYKTYVLNAKVYFN